MIGDKTGFLIGAILHDVTAHHHSCPRVSVQSSVCDGGRLSLQSDCLRRLQSLKRSSATGKQNGLSNLYKFRAKTAPGNYCNPFRSDNNVGNIGELMHVVNSTRMAAKCRKMKTARAKRAKLRLSSLKVLFIVIKYANL